MPCDRPKRPERPPQPAAHSGASPHRPSAQPLSGRARVLVGLLLLPLLLALSGLPAAQAQEQPRSPAYWQYAASDRLSTATLADVNADGVDELLVLDDNGRLALLAANGQLLWTYLSADPITAVGAANVDDRTPDEQEIALAGGRQLTLLAADGAVQWRAPIPGTTSPVMVAGYDYRNDGSEDILVLLASGELLAYDASGTLIWQFAGQEDAAANVNPLMVIADFDRDGVEEIALAMFTPRRFSQVTYLDNGAVAWRQSISRRITTLDEVPFGDDRSYLALGTNFGQVDLYAPDGELMWFRTLNRPISAMSYVQLGDERALLVGTTTGSVVAFTGEGRRLWTSNLARDADRSILALLPTGGRTLAGQSALAVTIESGAPSTEMADILLLGTQGQTLGKLDDTDLPAITRLVDINHDNHYELLLARFATLQLVGLGVGDSEYVQEWEYALDAAPSTSLIVDLNQDGEDEVLVGTRDGRLHALGNDRQILWLHAPGEEIALLDVVHGPVGAPPRVVVVRRERLAAGSVPSRNGSASWLELREAGGERVWEIVLPAYVTAMAVDDRDPLGQATIYLGTSDGRVYAYDASGSQLWGYAVEDLTSGIRQLLVYTSDNEPRRRLLAVGETQIVALSAQSGTIQATDIAAFDAPIDAVFQVEQPGGNELSVRLAVFLSNGQVHGLNWKGIEMGHLDWPFALGAPPVAIESSTEGAVEAFQTNATAFFVASADGVLQQLTLVENEPVSDWQIEGLHDVQALAWDDLDKDGRPDTGLVGTRDGRILLYDQLDTRTPRVELDLPVASGVFDLALLKRASRQSPDVLAMTQNGLIRLFREEENRPPLLTSPGVQVEQGQYAFAINALDVEGDTVGVQLELLDPTTDEWRPESEQRLDDGNGQLVWPSVAVPRGVDRVRYRFRFSDGFYRGYLTPPNGPAVPPTTGLDSTTTPVLIAALSLLLGAGAVAAVRQSRSPSAQAGRFYRRLRQQPRDTLILLEEQYAARDGSPDFLLQVANRARQGGDTHVASVADGLFLLSNRPQSGLAIITRTLDEVAAAGEPWEGLPVRRAFYRTTQALLEAPSVTELGLLRPQLVHVLHELEENKQWAPLLESLLPILTNIRDSERVDSVEDRLVYLNQAAARLRQLQERLVEHRPSVERTLVRLVARRWTGLLTAEIEEQRGRAELDVSLKTKRLIPNGRTHVAMEIRNKGRAAAENIIAVLDENPAYAVYSEPQTIAFLPSGRSRQVNFLIEPRAEERFRVGLSVTYDDRNRREKTAAFGDMVHLLPPVREFSPIPNPYLPGTPLRKESALFFGREELFSFIAENAGVQTQRNVLMLVGQRRTGKTSILLRLEEHLPPGILPVYIDCQSLGVTPGMPALLQEFAWHIADVMDAHGLDCPVPDPAAWEGDPGRVFRREFLTNVQALLPHGTTLLLVFDEFEAFEGMVSDGILPRTFFTYMRHLIQHSDGLGFIFVGTRRLEEMSADYWSVLFNTALYRKIDYLSDDAATRLICEPVSPHIVYDDLAIDKILRVTAGHPYFLQLVCYTLVKRANEQRTGYITISDVNAALDEMLRLGEVHFAYLWQRSSHAERAVLAAVAHQMDGNEPLHVEQLNQYLQSYSIELDPSEITFALNSLIERDIMRELTEEGLALYELRIGLVGQWVAQNKSLSRLHAHLES